MKTLLQIVLICFASSGFAQTLSLPPRPADTADSDAFVKKISALDLAARDEAVAKEFLAGNTPKFLRQFCAVTVTNVTAGKTNTATFFAAPDYLAIGSDENYFLAPVSPATAQRVADRLNCVLPTRKMVDAIYAAAAVKLTPSPIPPTTAMTTVPIFAQHNETIRAQRMALTNLFPLGALVAGHKKDVVITARLNGVTNKVAIYGWHQTNSQAIQPLYLGHVSWWVEWARASASRQQRRKWRPPFCAWAKRNSACLPFAAPWRARRARGNNFHPIRWRDNPARRRRWRCSFCQR